MARRHVVRWLGYPTKRDYVYFGVSQVTYALSAYCYYLALEGGDLEYLKAKMTYFAVLLIISLLLVITASVTVKVSINTLNSTLKVLSWSGGLLMMLYALTLDLGAGLDHHGQFNLMIYFLLWLPILLCMVLYYSCSAAKRKINNSRVFWGGLVTVGVAVGVYVLYALNSASREWYLGLGGRQLDPDFPSCGIYPPGAPWVAVLPDRTFNFFSTLYTAGSSECPPVTSFSHLSSDHILTINCDSPRVELVENPDYISMRNDTFVMLETGMELWANQTKSMEKIRSIPGHSSVKTEAEWLEVRCGSESNYHIQNVRNETLIDRLISHNKTTNSTRLNLLVFMLDTVSRAQIFRKMPNLVRSLETINSTGNSEVFQFFRLVSNGFATEMNTKAMYTGSLNRRERSGRPYWEILRRQGNAALYINGFCEDWMSTFLKKPFEGADIFAFLQWCHPDYHPYERTFGNFAGPFSILRRCINGKHVHKRLLGYIRQFWENYRNW